jgi:hypothetical protein
MMDQHTFPYSTPLGLATCQARAPIDLAPCQTQSFWAWLHARPKCL